jgi:glyoxylase-like metal-dependent hydrolase (beta-lactamase superfamily II)
VRELLPGLYLLPVPIPYPLKTVNLYLLLGDGEVALMDTALGTRAAKGTLELYLAELRLCFADISAVLLTHHHPDHYGLVGLLEGLGARVFLHEEELPRGTASGASPRPSPRRAFGFSWTTGCRRRPFWASRRTWPRPGSGFTPRKAPHP